MANGAAIGAGQAFFFLGFTAGDHQACGDFQFAEDVALFVLAVGMGVGGLHVVGADDFEIVCALYQPDGIGKGRQADA